MLNQYFYLTSVDSKEKIKIKLLIKKYNEILLYSVSIAVTEDLINLIIVNGDDKDFELIEIMKDRKNFREFISNEFVKLNSKSVLADLKNMDENFSPKILRRKAIKGNQVKLEI